VWQPSRHDQNIVAGFGLRFGRDGQEEFVALARDVVDLNLDLLLGSSFIDEIGGGFVRSGHPVIPETYRQLSGSVSAAHIRRSDERCGRHGGRGYKLSSRKSFVTIVPSMLSQCAGLFCGVCLNQQCSGKIAQAETCRTG